MLSWNPPFPRHRGRWRRPLLAGALIAAGTRCRSDALTGVVDAFADPPSAALAPGEPLATARWNLVTQAAVARNIKVQNTAWRAFAYVTFAEHVAVEAAARNHGATRADLRGVIAGASVPVLTYLFPADAARFDSVAQAEEASLGAEQRPAFRRALATGREIGARVVARAQADRFGAVWTGVVPTGPGKWSSLANPPAPPLLPLLGQVEPFFMTTGSQFRPPPPPAFGSPTFLAALAEVRHFADTRTPEQDSIAKFWVMGTGSLVAGYWNTVVLGLVARHGLGERAAAHALALMNTADLDANIACHDGKYTYWLIRPPAADPGIKLAIPLPNHPSYPSNHACQSGTAGNILASLFPAESERMHAMSAQAGLSRIYGGIHYRFDVDAGFEIARQLSALAVEIDQRQGLPSLLH